MTTATKERPILFSGPMVRAILDGKKTQTRRVAKFTAGGHVRLGPRRWHPEDPEATAASPYGQPGGRLWVRETWLPFISEHVFDGKKYAYRADIVRDFEDTERCRRELHYKWKPSIFMPREACRITLEVTGVRVELVQEISEEDAEAEGVKRGPCNCANWAACGCSLSSYRLAYSKLWDSLNAKRGFGWNKNPWVWVIEFKRVTD
jgi:hypothetical protein